MCDLIPIQVTHYTYTPDRVVLFFSVRSELIHMIFVSFISKSVSLYILLFAPMCTLTPVNILCTVTRVIGGGGGGCPPPVQYWYCICTVSTRVWRAL
jgi:hypothetical protein